MEIRWHFGSVTMVLLSKAANRAPSYSELNFCLFICHWTCH